MYYIKTEFQMSVFYYKKNRFLGRITKITLLEIYFLELAFLGPSQFEKWDSGCIYLAVSFKSILNWQNWKVRILNSEFLNSE